MYAPILNILLDKDNYYKFKDFIIKKHILPKEVYDIIIEIEEVYKNTSKDSIDLSSFITKYKLDKYPKYSKDKISIYDKLFNDWFDYEPDEDEERSMLYFLIEKDYSTRIADTALRIQDGDDSVGIEDLETLMKEFNEDTVAVCEEETIYSGFTLEDLDKMLSYSKGDGIEWRLEELNRSAGSVRAGDFIIVTANPDAGKTTFLCSEASYMSTQLPDDQMLLWANNEETNHKVIRRICQSLFGCTPSDIERMTNLEIIEESKKYYGGKTITEKIIFFDKKSIHTRDIDMLLAKGNFGVVVFDQLWKFNGFKESFSEVDKMTKMFGWAREVADKHQCVVINVHQASGDAYNQAWIGMEQMYNSRVGIQGEADLIIGIGNTPLDTTIAPLTRFINVSKNKLDGGPRSDPKLRNGRFQVELDPTIMRYKSFL